MARRPAPPRTPTSFRLSAAQLELLRLVAAHLGLGDNRTGAVVALATAYARRHKLAIPRDEP